MIIIGYQGIGKSTLSTFKNGDNKFVDLESSSLFVNGKRSDDWYIVYTNIAQKLSKQGKVVFISSHEVVRKALKESNETVVTIITSLNLKDEWIKKLKDRYESTKLEKDKKALLNAEQYYEINIKEIMDEGFDNIILKDTSYNLLGEIIKYIEKKLKK